MKTTMIGTKTNEQSAAIVPQPGVTHAIQQQVSLCQFDRLAGTLFNRRQACADWQIDRRLDRKKTEELLSPRDNYLGLGN